MFKKFAIPITCLLLVSSVFADTQLNKAQVLDILKPLTDSPQKTWIDSGTINAEHIQFQSALTTDEKQIDSKIAQALEDYTNNAEKTELAPYLQQMKIDAIPFNIRYELTNEFTMTSDVLVKYDNGKFLWQIDAKSRTDSVKPTDDLKDNEMTEDFKLFSNQKRTFSWDGEKYVRYFSPINHSIITAEAGGINGPLTAGLIKWGYDNYTFEKLSAATLSGIEKDLDGKKIIEVSIANGDIQETITLDADNALAVTEHLMTKGKYNTITTLQDYQTIDGKNLPMNIVIETTDTTDNRVIARDTWHINSVETAALTSEDFTVQYEMNSTIEDLRFGKPMIYTYPEPEAPSAKAINAENLLQARLDITSMAVKPNCGAIALKVAAENLGINADFQQIALNDNSADMQQLAQATKNLGLNSMAVKTDIASLAQMKNCQAILHLPKQNHYVVFAGIKNGKVSLIDLDSNKFLYSQSIENFTKDWQGTAMLISKDEISNNNVAVLDNNQLKEISGAATCSQCNTQIQSAGDSPCVPVGEYCSTHKIKYSRMGCGYASSGSCSTSSMIGGTQESCTRNGDSCTGNGNWSSYYIGACG